MKVLAIIGTPTGSAGYTTRSVEALEKSLQARHNVQFDYLYLEDLNLPRLHAHFGDRLDPGGRISRGHDSDGTGTVRWCNNVCACGVGHAT